MQNIATQVVIIVYCNRYTILFGQDRYLHFFSETISTKNYLKLILANPAPTLSLFLRNYKQHCDKLAIETIEKNLLTGK